MARMHATGVAPRGRDGRVRVEPSASSVHLVDSPPWYGRAQRRPDQMAL